MKIVSLSPGTMWLVLRPFHFRSEATEVLNRFAIDARVSPRFTR